MSEQQPGRRNKTISGVIVGFRLYHSGGRTDNTSVLFDAWMFQDLSKRK